MLTDSVVMVPGAEIKNAHAESGLIFPDIPSIGRLFYLTETTGVYQVGLYVFDGITWQTSDISSVVAGTGIVGGEKQDKLQLVSIIIM